MRRTLAPMISRRRFFKQAGAYASAVLMLPEPRHYKLGLQLFTIRAPLRQDVDGTLKRVAAIGYEEVETYGFDPEGIRYYGLDATTFAQRLTDLNLTTPSGHYDLNQHVNTSIDQLKRYMDRCIQGARALGQSYITWPLLDADSRTLEKFKVVAERLNIAGEQARSAQLQLAYHNHDFEFVDQNGTRGYDIILNETDPALVKLQMDLYWVARASQTPNELFRRAPGRFVMWHVKDVHRVSRDYTEVGNGTIDFTTIWPDAELAGLKHFFVEQGGNFTRDPIDSITVSAEYVQRVLLKRSAAKKK
jgi:sugar phosphate isomerase/epimerase